MLNKPSINPQVLLEAKFLNLVDLGNHAAIADLVPELIKHQRSFDPNHSEIFAIKDDWIAIVHYAQALEALESNDKQSFKKHITEAFLAKPLAKLTHSAHILKKLRLEEAMQSTQLPLDKLIKCTTNLYNQDLSLVYKR